MSIRILYDIGANIGKYADANIEKYSKIILVEANPLLSQNLFEKYKNNFKIVVENKIVSSNENPDFFISNADTISTCSKEWIEESRFAKNYNWTKSNKIEAITIDKLIEINGLPSFIKIDVEGYEENVIKSMSKLYCPVSFEWAEENKTSILRTIDYLYKLGYTKFNILEGTDDYRFEPNINELISYDSTKTYISGCNHNRKQLWGMIFCY